MTFSFKDESEGFLFPDEQAAQTTKPPTAEGGGFSFPDEEMTYSKGISQISEETSTGAEKLAGVLGGGAETQAAARTIGENIIPVAETAATFASGVPAWFASRALGLGASINELIQQIAGDPVADPAKAFKDVSEYVEGGMTYQPRVSQVGAENLGKAFEFANKVVGEYGEQQAMAGQRLAGQDVTSGTSMRQQAAMKTTGEAALPSTMALMLKPGGTKFSKLEKDLKGFNPPEETPPPGRPPIQGELFDKGQQEFQFGEAPAKISGEPTETPPMSQVLADRRAELGKLQDELDFIKTNYTKEELKSPEGKQEIANIEKDIREAEDKVHAVQKLEQGELDLHHEEQLNLFPQEETPIPYVHSDNPPSELKAVLKGGTLEGLGETVGDKIASVTTGKSLREKLIEFLPVSVKEIIDSLYPLALAKPRVGGTVSTISSMLDWARRSETKWTAYFNKHFTPEEFSQMGKAQRADEESFALTGKPSPAGVSSLPAHMRDIMNDWNRFYEGVAKQSVELGTMKEWKKSYMTREYVEIAPDGSIIEIADNISKGRYGGASGLRTTFEKLKSRTYKTAAEGVAALREALRRNVDVLNDVRILPIILRDLQEVNAAKAGINMMNAYGKLDLVEVTREGGIKPEGWFTIDHPAFRDWNKKGIPLHVHPDYYVPISTLLRTGGGPHTLRAIETALMTIKFKSVQLIINNPLVHGSVIWGKAIPYNPVGVLSFYGYWKGHLFRSGQQVPFEWMKDSWKKNSDFYNSLEFEKLAMQHNVKFVDRKAAVREIADAYMKGKFDPTESWIAQMSSWVAKKTLGKVAGDNTAAAFEKATEYYKGVALWNRIADLQGWMWVDFTKHIISNWEKKTGQRATPEMWDAAMYAAAEPANRYGGMLPYERMSRGLRTILNLTFFSRLFTGTNVGIAKDIVKGLPESTKGQMLIAMEKEHTVGEIIDFVKGADNIWRTKESVSMLTDMAGTYFGLTAGLVILFNWINSTDTFTKILGDEFSDIGKAWTEKMNKLASNPIDNWEELASLHEVLPQFRQEPGHQEGFKVGHEPDGTAIYGKVAIGKVGRELWDMWAHPGKYLSYKSSQFIRMEENLRAAHYPENVLEKIGQITGIIFMSFLPKASIEAVENVMNKEHPQVIDYLRMYFGILTPVTFSHGAPGGPERGVQMEAAREHNEYVKAATPELKNLLRDDKFDEAFDKMFELGMPATEIQMFVRETLAPTLRSKAMQRFYTYSNEKQQQLMEEVKP